MEKDKLHLTYCMNIHEGESWDECFSNICKYILLVKEKLNWNEDFGIGLRLSFVAANELRLPDNLHKFKKWLIEHDCYVFTINGFSYGEFHSGVVKSNVYLPDWSDTRRLKYTNFLADILSYLVDVGHLYGSISTVPIGFKSHIKSQKKVDYAVKNILQYVVHVSKLKNLSGSNIVLALEPEPCCYLETVDETIEFFNKKLLCSNSLKYLSNLTGLNISDSEKLIRTHVGVCLDTCHFAIEFEDPIKSVKKLIAHGIKIAKVQLSSGLRIVDFASDSLKKIIEFSEGVYLHQVVEKRNNSIVRFTDIPYALSNLSVNGVEKNLEWRVHFHMPIFMNEFDTFKSTQDFLCDLLDYQNIHRFTQHLEIETYTWSVIPKPYKLDLIEDNIVRELEWVKKRITS